MYNHVHADSIYSVWGLKYMKGGPALGCKEHQGRKLKRPSNKLNFLERAVAFFLAHGGSASIYNGSHQHPNSQIRSELQSDSKVVPQHLVTRRSRGLGATARFEQTDMDHRDFGAFGIFAPDRPACKTCSSNTLPVCRIMEAVTSHEGN